MTLHDELAGLAADMRREMDAMGKPSYRTADAACKAMLNAADEVKRLREALTTIFHEGGQAEARFALAALGDWKSEAGDLGGKQ